MNTEKKSMAYKEVLNFFPWTVSYFRVIVVMLGEQQQQGGPNKYFYEGTHHL